MLQFKWRQGKREQVFFHTCCWFTEGLISESLLTSDVQGFPLPEESLRREEDAKSLGEGVGLLYEKEFFSGFEGVCVLEVCSFSAVLGFALW